ncbi:nitrite reductase [Panus rudis PR-1116 ss-1]|nr:nitrite reductase [Panus rudis PR-1116 ss-1]
MDTPTIVQDKVSMAERKTIFVVGLGMIGIAFIEKLLSLDETRQYRIVTCGEEMYLAYNRVSLTEYFQHRNVEKLYLNDASWYAQQDPERFVFCIGETAISIDPNLHTVTTDKGRSVGYDYCVLATGSEASLPSFVDPTIPGVFVYRNIADLDKLLAYADQENMRGCKASVVGGGLLGLEAAKAIHDLPSISQVTILNRSSFPLSRQLDDMGGEIVLRRIEGMGVEVITNTSVKELKTQDGILSGLILTDDSVVECQIVVYSIGITPRDDLARDAGIECNAKRGIIVDDYLQTSAKDVFAIGECASWKGNTYGLIAPGIEMADILAFNFTQVQTEAGGFAKRKMNNPDMSTRLKLMGVDVACFGQYFAENNKVRRNAGTKHVRITDVVPSAETTSALGQGVKKIRNASSPKKRHGYAAVMDGPVESLVYRDPFGGVYKKYIFTADGKYLLGGMMVGDTSEYIQLLAIVKKKKPLEIPPAELIGGKKPFPSDSGIYLDDDAQICSCHNVTKGRVVACIKDGADSVAALKTQTKAGTGCGGCMPLLTNILKVEMKKAGHALSTNLCPHFAMSRADIFNVVRVKKLRTFDKIMTTIGVNKDSLGCEICKPAIGSILSSLWNEHIMDSAHHANQDTNDRFLANIQRNGTFSVIPRVPAGEITPDKLIVLGQVAKKYGLYTKITGGQRVDLFGAQKADLPSIWKELIDAGFESGHAYGKALRTVKSCVGTSWCRYGIGDSVGMAIRLEERYKGIRSPHKFKGGVSGCVRECAEAQGKDFGLIATDKGWNIFVCGNGGANPKHAVLFAKDVPPTQVIRILDRFLMYYIRTADKLMRTARWLESMEGGIEKLRKVILEDELGICEDLDQEMDALIGTFQDEWKVVVEDPEKQKRFRQFINTDERRPQTEEIIERGQKRPADWEKTSLPIHIRQSDIRTPKSIWKWRRVASVQDLRPSDIGATSAAVRYGDSQLAIFHVPRKGYFATQQMCPHKRAFVLEHGIVGDDPKTGQIYVSCPMHKRNFTLTNGSCMNDESYSILAFDVKVEEDDILLLLPDTSELDAVIGTSNWMIRQGNAAGAATDEQYGGVEIVGPSVGIVPAQGGVGYEQVVPAVSCGDTRLDW